jgi:hypothetical protein
LSLLLIASEAISGTAVADFSERQAPTEEWHEARVARVEIRVLSRVGIMRAIVDRPGCNRTVFNGDGVYGRDTLFFISCQTKEPVKISERVQGEWVI